MAVHDSLCGALLTPHEVQQRIHRQGVYWPTIIRKVKEVFGSCATCSPAAVCSYAAAAVGAEPESSPQEDQGWTAPIRQYLQSGVIPPDIPRRHFLAKMGRYVLKGDELYRVGYSSPLLKCLDEKRSELVLKDAHAGLCGTHMGARALMEKVIRAGFYWPTMGRDAADLVRRCDRCQRFAPVPRLPPTDLTPVLSPVPFAMWGMDFLGPFPQTVGQKKYLIVAIDYFTKWVEAEALSAESSATAEQFFWRNIICRFGIPLVLVTDNGTQFTSESFQAFEEKFGIEHRFSAVAHPQANGLAESANKNILKAIKKRLGASRKGSWLNELPSVLWGIRTSKQSATGETPFNLAYGADAVVPVEANFGSPRIEAFEEDGNAMALRISLDLVQEKRDKALAKMVNRQRIVTKHFNSKVRHREFKVGDMVLRKVEVSDPRHVGKLDPNWEGPYIVLQVVRPGTYKLKGADGRCIPRTWNAEHLKAYYQ